MTDSPIWIAPTRIHRLTQCLASGEGSRRDPATQSSPALGTDIGSIAHRALEGWVREGLWKEDADGTMLRHAYEHEGCKSGKDVNMQPGGRLLGVRIKNVGKSMRDRLAAVRADQVFAEHSAEDDYSRIRGVMDLLIVEDHVVHVYDYKTGRSAVTDEGRVADFVRTQLVAYGIILSRLYPKRQLRLSVVSPVRGIIDVPWDAKLASQIKSRILEFQQLTESQRDPHASPEEDSCRFCPRRLHCAPHWQTATSSGWTDLAEGEIIDVRRSDSGQFVIAIKTTDSVSWILNVAPEDVPDLPVGVPHRLRGVRLKRIRPEDSAELHFRANSDSEIVISASGFALPASRRT